MSTTTGILGHCSELIRVLLYAMHCRHWEPVVMHATSVGVSAAGANKYYM